jgi:hypothetical protein
MANAEASRARVLPRVACMLWLGIPRSCYTPLLEATNDLFVHTRLKISKVEQHEHGHSYPHYVINYVGAEVGKVVHNLNT